jgi:hypothetical protein
LKNSVRRIEPAKQGRASTRAALPEGLALNARCRALTRPIEATLNAQIDPALQPALRQWLVGVAKAFSD